MRVISGGQTGVDRAALDAALELGLPCGGSVPKGRLAEDGRVPDRYPVRECASAEYPVRTELNVREADATLVLADAEPAGGTRFTIGAARRLGKPCCVVRLGEPGAADKARRFLRAHRPGTLNVAGPRESGSPGIGERARRLLLEVLKEEAA